MEQTFVAETEVAEIKADLMDRRTFIGASDAPIILGLSNWSSPFQLYLEKTGQVEKEDLDKVERIMAGKLMEAVIADMYTWKYGEKLRRVNERKIRTDYGFPMVAQIDRKKEGARVDVEIKNVNEFGKDEWGEEGSDDIPLYYYAQVQHQLEVLGYNDAEVVPMIGGNRIRKYYIIRNNEFIQQMVIAEQNFWNRIKTLTPPDPISVDEASLRWSKARAATVEGTEIHGKLAARYLEINDVTKQLKEEQESIKLELQKVLQDLGDTLTVNGKPVISWKNQITNRIDTTALKEEMPEIAAKFTKASESRRFVALKAANDFRMVV